VVEEPSAAIERHGAELRALSEEAFLAELDRLPALADEDDDAVWDQEGSWDAVYRLLAAAKVIGERGWVKAIVPLFERAAKGDLYGTMLDIRHGPERAISDSAEFAAMLEPLTKHPRAGTRRWSVRELGILRQRSSLQPLVDALADEDDEVREEARQSLEMLAQDHPEVASLAPSSANLPGHAGS
jgi:hypothetical protein